jgi:energy-coupling factor transporter transmembrane protein EcfT
MAQALIFHYRDSNTCLNKTNPFIKLLSLLLLCTTLVKANIYGTLIILIATFILMIITKLPIIKYGKELTFFIIISLFIAITSIFSDKTIIETINSVLKFDTAILMSFLLADSSDPSDIARALGKTLNHIPFVNGWKFSSQIELTLMCLPLIFEVSQSIGDARSSRLENIKKHPLKYIANYSISLLDNLLYRIDEIAYALDSREYNHSIERDSIKYKFSDFVFLFSVLILIGATFYVG